MANLSHRDTNPYTPPAFAAGCLSRDATHRRESVTGHLHISSQNSFYCPAGDAPRVIGDVCTISGKYLWDLGTTPPGQALVSWADFTTRSQEDIETLLRDEFLSDAPTVSVSTTGIMVLDIETGGVGGVEGHFSHPNHLWQETDADKALIIAAWKRRIAAVRAVFPNARVGMYALPRAGNLGDEDIQAGDGNWSDRIETLVQAGTAAGYNGVGGAYDDLDLLIPICYQIWGPNDTAERWGSNEARTVQAMEGAALIKKSDGSSIPAMPFLSTCVFGAASEDDGVLLTELDTADSLGETWGVSFTVFQEYGIDEVCIWNGLNSQFARDGAGETTTLLRSMTDRVKTWWPNDPLAATHRG